MGGALTENSIQFQAIIDTSLTHLELLKLKIELTTFDGQFQSWGKNY